MPEISYPPNKFRKDLVVNRQLAAGDSVTVTRPLNVESKTSSDFPNLEDTVHFIQGEDKAGRLTPKENSINEVRVIETYKYEGPVDPVLTYEGVHALVALPFEVSLISLKDEEGNPRARFVTGQQTEVSKPDGIRTFLREEDNHYELTLNNGGYGRWEDSKPEDSADRVTLTIQKARYDLHNHPRIVEGVDARYPSPADLISTTESSKVGLIATQEGLTLYFGSPLNLADLLQKVEKEVGEIPFNSSQNRLSPFKRHCMNCRDHLVKDILHTYGDDVLTEILRKKGVKRNDLAPQDLSKLYCDFFGFPVTTIDWSDRNTIEAALAKINAS